jgi:hypothetical protein
VALVWEGVFARIKPGRLLLWSLIAAETNVSNFGFH